MNMKTVMMLLALMASAFANAETSQQFVIGFNHKELYLYDDALNEVGSLKTKKLAKTSVDVVDPVTNGPVKLDVYYKIIDENDDEDLWGIEADGKKRWVEKMAVGTWPGNKLSCPESDIVIGRESTAEIEGTIGLGEHCK